MEEIWKTVVVDGEIYEGYEVSNMGRVRSLDYRRTGKVKGLKFCVNKGGYLRVALCKNGERKYCLVHRLVAYAFIENDNPIEKTEANHLDENPRNNRADNLSWVTPKQNINHGTRTERQAKSKSKKVVCLETSEVFESMTEAERKLGLSNSSICKCCNGKLKTCGGYHWQYYDDYLAQQKENAELLN